MMAAVLAVKPHSADLELLISANILKSKPTGFFQYRNRKFIFTHSSQHAVLRRVGLSTDNVEDKEKSSKKRNRKKERIKMVLTHFCIS